MIFITGDAGFIGGNFVLDWLAGSDEPEVNLDKLSYGGSQQTLPSLQEDPRHIFAQGDIGDRALVEKLLTEHRPRAVIHFAAESHVDRSIHGPAEFIQTNIVGTFSLLESVRAYWQDGAVVPGPPGLGGQRAKRLESGMVEPAACVNPSWRAQRGHPWIAISLRPSR